jgi:hypothetical protein
MLFLDLALAHVARAPSARGCCLVLALALDLALDFELGSYSWAYSIDF